MRQSQYKYCFLKHASVVMCALMQIGCADANVEYCFKAINERDDLSFLEAREEIHNIRLRIVDDMQSGRKIEFPIIRDDKLYLAGSCHYIKALIAGLDKAYVVTPITGEEYKAELIKILPRSQREEFEKELGETRRETR